MEGLNLEHLSTGQWRQRKRCVQPGTSTLALAQQERADLQPAAEPASRTTAQEAKPRNTMSDRSMSAMSAADTRPTRCPRLVRRTVVILSIMA
jgi:hypothetical protein